MLAFMSRYLGSSTSVNRLGEDSAQIRQRLWKADILLRLIHVSYK